MKIINQALSFDDVLISPRYSKIKSRKDVSLKTFIGNNLVLNSPIISANMDTITESKMAKAMAMVEGVGCLHRFLSIEENVNLFLKSPKETIVSIGVGPNELERARSLFNAGASNFVIDVAHGAAEHVVEQYDALREIVGTDSTIIIGNVATGNDIEEFINNSKSTTPPQAFKVGIGGGSMCTTRIVTGCGLPTFHSILDCSSVAKRYGVKIIGDGGIKNSGDIVKALAAGADAVMIGSILSGTEETPGEIVAFETRNSYGSSYTATFNNYREADVSTWHKKYRGSASKESYEVQGKQANHRTPEGEATFVKYKGSAIDILNNLIAGIKSGLSYVGANTLDELKENAQFVSITNSGLIESKPHGKKS